MGLSLFWMITEILIMISTKKYLKITLIQKYYNHNTLSHIVMKLYLRKFWHPANFHPDVIWLQSQWKPYYRMANRDSKRKKKSALQIFTNTSQEVGPKESLEETKKSKLDFGVICTVACRELHVCACCFSPGRVLSHHTSMAPYLTVLKYGLWASNSSSHACKASVLVTEPFLQPLRIFFSYLTMLSGIKCLYFFEFTWDLILVLPFWNFDTSSYSYPFLFLYFI